MSNATSLRRAILLAFGALAAVQSHCQAFSAQTLPLARTSSTGKAKISPVASKIPLFAKAASEDEDRSRPNIVVIQNHEDYVKFLQEDDRLCIIKYYASWCKSCQRFGIKFRHLAFEEGDRVNAEGSIYHTGRVRFAEVEYSSAPKLCKALKVKKLPTVHFHREGSGKIADICTKPSLFHVIVDELHRLLDDSKAQSTPDLEIVTEIDAKLKEESMESNANATSASFDQAMAAGSSLADEILTFTKEEKKEETKKKEKWFPFSF